MIKIAERLSTLKREFLFWYADIRNEITVEDIKVFIVAVIIGIIALPILLVYEIIIKNIYKGVLTLIDMRKMGIKKSFRYHFFDDDNVDINKSMQGEKELEARLSLDGEVAKSFIAKKLWPDSVVRDGVAIYSSDGRTLLHVHEKVEEFVVPEGTVNIYHKCFSLCTRLTTVSLPTTLCRIGNEAFSHCIALKELVVPESVESIGDSVFKNCLSLEAVQLPSSMVEIPQEMFYNCQSLRAINLPEATTMICQKAFARCFSLEHIQTNNILEMIRERAFEDCRSLKEFYIQDSVRFIEKGTFNNCHSLEKLHLSKIMKQFGGSCCENCWSLQEVTMTPDENFIKYIRMDWEENCKGLKPEVSEYPYPENRYWSFEGALYKNVPRLSNVELVLCLSKEEEFTIPDFVTDVKQYAFTTCKTLKRLRLSPKLHPLAENWDSKKLITHEFILEYWPQIDKILFDETLNPEPGPIHFI